MGRPKKQAEVAPEQLPAPPSLLIGIEEVIDAIKVHNDDVANKISHHLKMVKQNTGDIQPEDISYVLGLSSRELLYNFTKRLDE